MINSIKLPEMSKYYIKESNIAMLQNKLIMSDVDVRDDKIYMYCYCENIEDVYDMLELIKVKSSHITLHNQILYEYDLGISILNGHLFNITIDQKNYACKLEVVNRIDGGKNIELVFDVKMGN